MAWADQEVLTALSSQPPSADWVELFGHIVGAEHVWLARLESGQPEIPVWPRLSLDQCSSEAEKNRQGFAKFLAGLAPEDDQRQVRYRNSAGQEFSSAIGDVLLHVCLHGSYHRGQIAAAMRQGKAAPAPTDYIGFVRGSPAATRSG